MASTCMGWPEWLASSSSSYRRSELTSLISSSHLESPGASPVAASYSASSTQQITLSRIPFQVSRSLNQKGETEICFELDYTTLPPTALGSLLSMLITRRDCSRGETAVCCCFTEIPSTSLPIGHAYTIRCHVDDCT